MSGKFNRDSLWALRQEIVLNSMYTKDYRNSAGVDAYGCQGFFDGYSDYLAELMMDNGIDSDAYFDHLKDYDTPGNLWAWYGIAGATVGDE